MSNRTYTALLARGFDSALATELANKKLSISKLKKLSDSKLKSLGLSDEQINTITKEPRPPIPTNTMHVVLHKSRRTCCVCRDPSQPIIVHHIEEWAKSKSHDISNLVVLCLNHHDLAHTHKGLSASLPPNQIRDHKKKWENDVGILDAKAILGLKDNQDCARWDWVNIRRVSELMLQLGLKLPKHHVIEYLKSLSIVDKNSLLRDQSHWMTASPSYFYLDFGEGMYVGFYLDMLVRTVVSNLHIVDITNVISKEELRAIIKAGDFIAIQRGFYFKKIDEFEKGKRQLKEGYYRGHGIRIQFTYDAWYCTSSSARFDSMVGHKEKTVLGFVTGITDSDGTLIVSLSCLAVGSYFASARG